MQNAGIPKKQVKLKSCLYNPKLQIGDPVRVNFGLSEIYEISNTISVQAQVEPIDNYEYIFRDIFITGSNQIIYNKSNSKISKIKE